MSVSQAKSSVANLSPDSPVAEWILLDSLNAKVALKGKVNVYTLAHTWTLVREKQDAWLLQSQGKNPILTFDASQVTSLDGSGFAFLIDVEEAQKTAGGQL